MADQRITHANIRRGLWISLAISFAGIIALLLRTTDSRTWQLIRSASWPPLLGALVAVMVAWAVEACRLWSLLRLLDEDVAPGPLLSIVLSTAFAAGVTPLASGQGPVQVYLFHRQGVSLGKATAVLSIRLLLTTLVFTISAPLLLVAFRVSVSYRIHMLLNYAVVFSFALAGLIILFILKPRVSQAVVIRFLSAKWIQRHFHPERLERLIDRFVVEVGAFRSAIGSLDRQRLPYLLAAVFLTFLYWALYYLVAPALLLAFHLPFDLTRVMVLQTVFFFILSSVPIPGGSGVAEIGFASIFTHMVPGSLLGVYVSLWRLFTYYLMLLVGAGTFFASLSPKARA